MLNGILTGAIDMNHVCRTCLETGELVSIFNPCATGPSLLDKLTSVTSEKFYDCVGLPTQLCSACICEINRAYKFATKCEETDQKLREYIRTSNSQSANESTTNAVGHLEKDIMENRNTWMNSINQRFKKQKLNSHNTTSVFSDTRTIHVKISYDSDESEFGEVKCFRNFSRNNELQNGDFGYGYDGQQSSNEVNRKRKMVYNDEFLGKDIKSELTSEIDLGTTEFYINMDADLQIKTESVEKCRDYSLENYQNYLDQESQLLNTNFTKQFIEPKFCNRDINLKPRNSLDTPINKIRVTKLMNIPNLESEVSKTKTIEEKASNSQIDLKHSKHATKTDNSINQTLDIVEQNIEKEIPLNQEFDIVPPNIEKQISPIQVLDINPLNQEFAEQIPPNQEFAIVPPNIEKQIPPNQEFDIKRMNINEQIPPNQEFNVDPLQIDEHIPLNQEFVVDPLNIDKQMPLNQEFNVEQLNIDKKIPLTQELDLESSKNTVDTLKQILSNQQLDLENENSPNKKLELKLSTCGIYFEKHMIADIDLTLEHSDFVEQMETLQLLKIQNDDHPDITDEIDLFENSIQRLIDQESVPMIIDDQSKCDKPAISDNLSLNIKPTIDECDPLAMNASIDCDAISSDNCDSAPSNNSLDVAATTKSNNEIIFAEINIENVHSDVESNKIYYKINSNICTLNNKVNNNKKNLNYQNVILNNSESLTSANRLANRITVNRNKRTCNKRSKMKPKLRNIPRKIYSKSDNLITNTELPIVLNKTDTLIDLTISDDSNSDSNTNVLTTNVYNVYNLIPNTENCTNDALNETDSNSESNTNVLPTDSTVYNVENNNLIPNTENCANDALNATDSNSESNTNVLTIDLTVNNFENNNLIPNTENCANDELNGAGLFKAKKYGANNRLFYQCTLCNRFVRHLRKHILMHNKQTDWMCEICGEFFKFHQQFTKHQRLHNSEMKKHKCNICSDEFSELTLFKKHKAAHKNKIDTCGKCGAKLIKSQNHICEPVPETEQISLEENDIKCDKCPDVFTTIDTYNTHYETHKVKIITCTECDLNFGTTELLEEHAKSHKLNDHKKYSLERPYSCDICGRQFTFNAQLIYHSKVHKNKTPTECAFCAEKFKVYEQFRRHKCKCTKCPKCNKTYDSIHKLKAHFRSHRS